MERSHSTHAAPFRKLQHRGGGMLHAVLTGRLLPTGATGVAHLPAVGAHLLLRAHLLPDAHLRRPALEQLELLYTAHRNRKLDHTFEVRLAQHGLQEHSGRAQLCTHLSKVCSARSEGSKRPAMQHAARAGNSKTANPAPRNFQTDHVGTSQIKRNTRNLNSK